MGTHLCPEWAHLGEISNERQFENFEVRSRSSVYFCLFIGHIWGKCIPRYTFRWNERALRGKKICLNLVSFSNIELFLLVDIQYK